MNSESLFSMALGLQSPWKVEEIIFSNDGSEPHELHLHIGFDLAHDFLMNRALSVQYMIRSNDNGSI